MYHQLYIEHLRYNELAGLHRFVISESVNMIEAGTTVVYMLIDRQRMQRYIKLLNNIKKYIAQRKFNKLYILLSIYLNKGIPNLLIKRDIIGFFKNYVAKYDRIIDCWPNRW